MANETSKNIIKPEREVTMDVCGVSMFLPDNNTVLLIDGRKPRKAVNTSAIIPPHIPFLAFVQNTAKVVPNDGEKPKEPKLSFEFDVDGRTMKFDAFILEGHRISVEGVVRYSPQREGKKFLSMGDLAPGLELCTGAISGTSREIVGLIDCSNAAQIKGKPHHKDDGPLRVGNDRFDYADMVAAVFEAEENKQPLIRLKNDVETLSVELTGKGPWQLLAGNVPFDELVANHTMEEGHDIPLTHIELVYDLYHLGKASALPVPRADNHKHAQTANGRCGPTVVPSESPTRG